MYGFVCLFTNISDKSVLNDDDCDIGWGYN